MTDMFHRNFDPLAELIELKEIANLHHSDLAILKQNVNELVKAVNSQARLITQLTEQNTQLLTMIPLIHGDVSKDNK